MCLLTTCNDKDAGMPPRVNNLNKQKPISLNKKIPSGAEKENICLDKPLKEKKNDRNTTKLLTEEIKSEESERMCLSPEEQKLKTVGFWSRKLRDLEIEKNVVIEGKRSLYEFSGTDESESYQKKKKSKRKTGVSKRKRVALPKCNKPASLHKQLGKKEDKVSEAERKIKQTHRQSFFREQLMLSKERERLADGGKKFTFSARLPTVGVTSTPALNKDNLIGASNFLFLSPIIKEETECRKTTDECTPLKSKAAEGPVTNPGQEILTTEAALKKMSCRRVLRSGKILDF